MDAEPLICSVCRGTSKDRFGTVKQCRNSAAWRRAQHAPAVCPFGAPLDHLPIGDNVPAGALLQPFPAKRADRTDCTWAARLSCCKTRCTHPAGQGLTFVNAHCSPQRCRYFEEGVPAHTH